MTKQSNDLDKFVVGTRLLHRMKSGVERIVVIREAGSPGWAYAYEDDPTHLESCGAEYLRRPSNFRLAGDAPPRPLPIVEFRQPPADLAPEVIVRAVAPALPPAPTESIVVNPEDLGVPDYVVRGRGCVIVADVERALDYAPRSLPTLLGGAWAAEIVDGQDFAILKGAELRAFKAHVALINPKSISPNTGALMVLFEGGFDLVLLKTEKPEGAALRARLRERVLPKLRRGEPVAPTTAPAQAPSSDAAEMRSMFREMLTEARDERRENREMFREIIGRLATPQAPSPQAPAALPQARVERLIPRDWISSAMIKGLLKERHPGKRVNQKQVDTAIEACGVRERTDVSAHRMIPRDSSGVPYEVPMWRYAPSVLDEIDRHISNGPSAQQRLKNVP